MQYDPIQGQGHEPLKVGNSAIFKGYLLPPLQWGLGTLNLAVTTVVILTKLFYRSQGNLLCRYRSMSDA